MTTPNTSASAYIKGNRLCILGLHDSAVGPIPFAHHVDLKKEAADGPVNIGDDTLDPEILRAVDESRKPIMANLQSQEMQMGVQSIVERARVGDQNAMAMIVGVREAAKKGGKRAQVSLRMMANYIKANPVGAERKPVQKPGAMVVSRMTEAVKAGADSASSAISTLTPGTFNVYVAAIVIANGPPLSADMVKNIADRLDDSEVPIFAFAFTYYQDPAMMKQFLQKCDPMQKRVAFTGHAVGLAQTLQGVRSGNYPLSRLCPVVGWEMGE